MKEERSVLVSVWRLRVAIAALVLAVAGSCSPSPGPVPDPQPMCRPAASVAGRVVRSAGVVPRGPEGAWVADLAVDPFDPRVLYAASFAGGGVWRSVDGSRTWEAVGRGMADANVRAVVVDPHAADTVYVGTEGNGVFRSTDRGERWSPLGPEDGPMSVFALALATTEPVTLYAGTLSSGVLRWEADRATWTRSDLGLPSPHVRALAVDPVDPDVVYVGLHGSGVYRSDDRGAHWRPAHGGVLASAEIRALAIDPVGHRTMYAATYGEGIFVSHDAGASWTRSDLGVTNPFVRGLAIDPSDHRRVFASTFGAGIFVSDDAGAHWHTQNDGLPGLRVRVVAFDPIDPRRVYAGLGSAGGIARSVDGGEGWMPASTGMANTDVRALAMDASGQPYAGVWNLGVFAIAQGQWVSRSAGLPPYASVRALATDPDRPSTMYALTSEGAAFRSDDRGATWRPLPRIGGGRGYAIVVVASSTLVVASDDGIRTLAPDGGVPRPWSEGLPEPVCALAASRSGGRVFAAMSDGVFVRGVEAPAWRSIGSPAIGSWVAALAVVGRTPLAATSEGVFRLEADGRWTRVGPEGIRATAIAVDPASRGAVVVGTNDGHLYASEAHGARDWASLGGSVSGSRAVQSLAFASIGGERSILVGSRGAGVIGVAYPLPDGGGRS